MKVLVTGKPGCGKTTLCERLVKVLKFEGRKVGGVVSKEIRKNGVRMGFKLIDVATGREGVLAHVSGRGPEVGKYKVNLRDLEDIGAGSIERAIQKGMLVVIDEIGPMELHSRRFIDTVERAFESELDILATIHYRSRHPLVERLKYMPGVELLVLDQRNRDEVFEGIAGRLGL
ncbi:MAG: NTPase, partial [Candidatus Hydrothermarchaeaceae archaeon]